MENKKYHNYLIYEDGRVYSLYRKKFLAPDIVNGYHKYSLSIDGLQKRFGAHQLVAKLFLENNNNYPQVNHKDGNKSNNHYSNLEWCTAKHNNKHARETGLNDVSLSNERRAKDKEYSTKVGEKISKTRIEKGVAKAERNPRYRYKITKDGSTISKKDLIKIFGLSESRVNALIAKQSKDGSLELFKKHSIKVEDIKKVNRLSKTHS